MKTIRTSDQGRHGPLPGKRKKVLDWVRQKVSFGELKPGDRLPDRKWFRETFGIADHPVQQAFAELESEGFVRPVPGHGTHVAEDLPFANRYLLLLRADRKNAGVNLFAPALQAAAERVAAARGVRFEVRHLVDVEGDSQAYAETLSELRRQRFAGVIAQDVTLEDHGLETFTNVNHVPIAHFGTKSVCAQGDLAVSFGLYERPWEKTLITLHLEALKAKGCTRFAVFRSYYKGCAEREAIERLAREHGLELVRNGYHHVGMNEWDAAQFARWIELFLDSDAGRAAEGVVLGDDNMLAGFVTACRRRFGAKAAERYAVSCHCNFPCPPRTDYPVDFHGPDLVAAVNSLVDFAEDVRTGVRRPRQPHLTVL